METYIVKKKDDKLFLYKGEQEVGQVSPEATWVKEGDEFDEYKIKHYRFDAFGELDTYSKTKEEFDKFKEEYQERTGKPYEHISRKKGCGSGCYYGNILLKGPCGHFH